MLTPLARLFSLLLLTTALHILAPHILTAEDSPPTKSFVYKKTPQTDLSLTPYLPPDWKPTDKRPAIVFFFGGGWTKGSPLQFEPQAQYFARRGLVCFCADYRVKSRHEVKPDACVADAKSAIRWVRQHAPELGVDPDRIVGSGGSAGGHIAACAGICPGLDEPTEDLTISSRPNLLILFNPVLSFASKEFAARVDSDLQRAAAISPITHLAADSPPTLIFFGSKDRLAIQGEAFLTRAQQLKHPTEYDLTPDQNHGFFNNPPFRENTLHRATQFLTTHHYLPEENK